jgi:predicted neutral ceramidase superfamily lipid hydrolase
MIKKIDVRFYVLAGMVLLAGLCRLVPHLHNFTSIGAMALFGGAYFSNSWKAYLTPLFSLLLSDLIIQGIVYRGQYGFPLYDSWYWVYGTFAIIVFLGTRIIKHVKISTVLLASIIAALAHWIITDFWVWYSGCNITVYTKDLKGFILCYTMAVPYMMSFLMGTVFYSVILFGGFELIQKRYPALIKS